MKLCWGVNRDVSFNEPFNFFLYVIMCVSLNLWGPRWNWPNTSFTLTRTLIALLYVYRGAGNGNPLQCVLPGKYHGQRSLVGYSPKGCQELDTTERLRRKRSPIFKTLGRLVNYENIGVITYNEWINVPRWKQREIWVGTHGIYNIMAWITTIQAVLEVLVTHWCLTVWPHGL